VKKIKQFFKAFFQSGATNLELLRQIRKLEEEKIHDPLTKVYNRRGLEELGGKEFERAKRYKRPLTLIFLDIDKFKEINRWQGHLVGDEALKVVAVVLSNYCRKTDSVFRYGGDEFLVMMPETEEDGAREFLNRINWQLSFTSLRISSGIATYNANYCISGDFSSLKQLIDEADRRMRQEKESKVKA